MLGVSGVGIWSDKINNYRAEASRHNKEYVSAMEEIDFISLR